MCQPQLMAGTSQSYLTWEGVINHPSSSTSLALASVCCALMSVHHTRTVSVPHSPLPSSHLLTVQPFLVNPSHLCSSKAPETAGQAHSLLLGAVL